jgi:hypothetical protein
MDVTVKLTSDEASLALILCEAFSHPVEPDEVLDEKMLQHNRDVLLPLTQKLQMAVEAAKLETDG